MFNMRLCFMLGLMAATLCQPMVWATEPSQRPEQVIQKTIFVKEGVVNMRAPKGDVTVNVAGHVSATTIQVGNTKAPCEVTLAGALKFNTATERMEFCNGHRWMPL